MDKAYEAFFEKLAEISMNVSSNMNSTKSDPMIASSKPPAFKPSTQKTKMPTLHQYTRFRNPGGSIQFSSNRSMM